MGPGPRGWARIGKRVVRDATRGVWPQIYDWEDAAVTVWSESAHLSG